jgi:hypothetical protein
MVLSMVEMVVRRHPGFGLIRASSSAREEAAAPTIIAGLAAASSERGFTADNDPSSSCDWRRTSATSRNGCKG